MFPIGGCRNRRAAKAKRVSAHEAWVAPPRFAHAVSLLARNVRRREGARDEHIPLTLEELAPLQAQDPLHLWVAQGRWALTTTLLTEHLLLGKQHGSGRHRRRRRKCCLLGRRHASQRSSCRPELHEEQVHENQDAARKPCNSNPCTSRLTETCARRTGQRATVVTRCNSNPINQ